MILAWNVVLAEGRDAALGTNLVVHEFTHQLDFLDGLSNGTPDLAGATAWQWAQAMDAEYTRLRQDLRAGRDTFLGAYAATNEAEFFAVCSERFYTQPSRLRRFHEPVYQVLAEYYGVEPSEWFGNEAVAGDK